MSQLVGVVGSTSAAGRHQVSPRQPKPSDRGPALVPTSATGFSAALDRAVGDRRFFVLLPFAIIAGLICSLLGTSQPEPALLLGGAGMIAVASPLALRSTVAGRVLTLAAAFWLGFSLLAIHGALSGTTMLGRPAYGVYEARVDRVLSSRPDGTRVVVSNITPADGARGLPVRLARLVIREGPELVRGDLLRGPIRFYPVPGPVLPGGFDTQFHAYFDGIGAYGSTTRPPEVIDRSNEDSASRLVDAVRRSIGDRIEQVLQQPAAGIARALITGDQSEVDEKARNVMATAGLAHVLAISGLHLSLVAGTVFVVVRMVLVVSTGASHQLPVKRLAALCGIAAALLYFSISGGSVAATRATIMITLVLGAVIFGRRALTMRNVAIAALIVLLTDPPSVFRPSFQLSFAAVVALIGAWELTRGREWRDRSPAMRMLGYFGGIAVTSLVAGAATLLFSIYHFQQTSPLGIIGNLVSLPLVAFVMMPSAMLAAILMPLGLEGSLLWTMGWSIDLMLYLAGLVSVASKGIDASPLLTPLALVLGLAALAWFAFLPTWHRLIGPALLVPAVTLVGLDRPPDVIIADTTQAVAVRLDTDLSVIAGKADSFAVDVWRETYDEALAPAEIACDSIACVASSTRGFDVAIVRDPAGFYEECGVDLIVTRRHAPTTGCRAGTVVDAGELASGGVHWLRWDSGAGGFEVKRAIPDRNRPWRAPL